MQVEHRTSYAVLSPEIFVSDRDKMVCLVFAVVRTELYLKSPQSSLTQSEMISQMSIPAAE